MLGYVRRWWCAVRRFVAEQRGISSAGRAPALQAGGRRFDPVILHHLELIRKTKTKIKKRKNKKKIKDLSGFNNKNT